MIRDSGYVTDDVPVILGRPARTFEQFAAGYAAACSRRWRRPRAAAPSATAIRP